MRTPSLLLAAALLATGLAGCLAGPTADPGPDNASADPGNVTLAPDVVRYTGNGTMLPLPSGATANVSTWYKLTGHEIQGEPTMGITDSGAIFATGSSDLYRSTDGGLSWENVFSAINSNDPLMDYDHSTDTIYMDPMAVTLACTQLAWSTDDGESWTTNPATCHPPPMDHQKLFSGPPSPDAPPVAGAAADNVLYQCYNQLFDTVCAVSYDGGVTWVNQQVVADQARHSCGGINGFGEVGPNGTAAVPMADDCEQITVAVTHDSGATWELARGPAGPGTNVFDPEVDFGADGAMYVVWRGSDEGTWLARSPDQGGTWQGPWELTPPGANATMYPTLNVGANGKAAVGLLASPTAPGPEDAEKDARWYLHAVTTDDVTATSPVFTSYQITPDDDPVQVGRICTGGFGGCPNDKRNLLEFIDSSIHPNGTFNVVYTEGCVDDCVEDPTSDASKSSQMSLARLEGWTMTREDW